MKIEMVVSALDVGGLESVVIGLVRTLGRLGHDAGVTCIEKEGVLSTALRADGARVTVIRTPGLRTNVFPLDLAEWFRRLRPDVMHVHSGAWLKAARASRLARVSGSVYTLHGIWPEPPWYIPIYSRLAASQTDRIVAVSDSLKEHVSSEWHIRRSKVEVIENGIDTAAFSPGRRTGWLRGAFGPGISGPVLGTVGRLHAVKNQLMLIDAFGIVRRRFPSAGLVIVGEGDMRPALEDRIHSNGLAGAVLLPGASDDVLSYYREFDLFVLPSIIEGTSMSGLEAMASGLCVVATAVGGNPRLLGDGAHGVLVPPGDTEELASAITDLLENPDRRKALAMAARRKAVADHDDGVVAGRYLRTYAAAMESRRRG
jgi:glycosyltransferase involved in cell wall biosynthesis